MKFLTYLIFLIICVFALIIIFYFERESKINEGKYIVKGQIISEIEEKENKDRFIFEIKELKRENQAIYPNEKIIVHVSKYLNLYYLDELELQVELKLPENFLNENNIEFDYVNFLKKDKIFFISYNTEILKHEKNNKKNLTYILYQFKKKYINQVNQIYETPQAELLNGILLGEKKSLGKKLENDFRKAGLIHIVVLSGFNVTIIAIFLIKILSFLPNKISYPLGAISIFLFSIMVGNGATVVRSAIMSTFALISKLNFATFDVNKALFLAGSIMIAHNPYILIYDPSFQLSFIATFGLINIGNWAEKITKIIPKNPIKEIIIATLSTQIAVLPLLIKMTGEVSLVAPIVNVITLPLIPILMLLGFISVVISFINFEIGLMVVFIPNLILSYLILVVEFFANLKFATFNF